MAFQKKISPLGFSDNLQKITGSLKYEVIKKILNRTRLMGALLAFVPIAMLSYLLFTNPPSKVFGGHSRVDLRTTDDFAVLAGSAISDTGTTTIIGNVGLDPTGGASITGLTCAEVTGTIYDNDGLYVGGGGGSTSCRVTNSGLLTTAKNDLTTAYNDAAGRTTTSTIGTELGGSTLTDGTYDSAAGTFGITGTLTLNGSGNANAVFIFKMASTLITASSSKVVLINGAQACNVYWQVGSSATLGTSTTLVGNVFALTSITDDGSSTVNGRLLARNGAVTLNNTTISKQGCAPGTSGGAALTSSSGSSSCPALSSTIVSPNIVGSKRVDADSVFVSWGPYSGIDTFIVQYGIENGKWLYSTNVTGFSTTLNDLPSNQPIWVRVAARNDCYIGTYGQSKLVGGPLLPNTGLDPNDNNFSRVALGAILLTFTSFIFLRKRIESTN